MNSDPINSSNPQNQDRRVERVLASLRREYVVVGKTRVRAWHAWLILGVFVGIVAAVFLVANRSGEVEEGEASPTPTKTVKVRPNIVVILMDDMRLDDMWVMKNVKDLIASDGGVSFSNFFVSNSICCPSRATFMTGKYSHNHGVMGNNPGYAALDDHRNTLGVWLQNAGYYTYYIGKYMNGYGKDDANEVPGAPPYEVVPGWNDWHALITPSEYFYFNMIEMTNNGPVARNTYGTSTAKDPDAYITDIITQKSVDFINDRATSTTPFFLMIGEKTPHFETVESEDEENDLNILRSFIVNNPPAAPRDEGKFANEPIPQLSSLSFNENDVSDKPIFIRLFPLMTAKELSAVRDFYRNRWESLLSVDDGVGKIMAALQQAGKLDNTVVIFTSDNGFMLGEHRIPLGKDLLYEESSHLPFIMKMPGMSGSRTIDKLVANVDIAPTILELAGGSPCATTNNVSECRDMDGRSFLPLLKAIRGGKIPWRTAVLLESPEYSAVRTNDYAYGVHSTGEEELYNFVNNSCHRADPFEIESQHKNSCYQANGTADNLRNILNVLKTCSGADCWQ